MVWEFFDLFSKKGRVTKIYFAKMIRIDQSCTIFNVLALGLSVIQYDLEFQERDDYVLP